MQKKFKRKRKNLEKKSCHELHVFFFFFLDVDVVVVVVVVARVELEQIQIGARRTVVTQHPQPIYSL